jgi:hypothetical protein
MGKSTPSVSLGLCHSFGIGRLFRINLDAMIGPKRNLRHLFECKFDYPRGPYGRHFLQILGPTNVPGRVLRAMDTPTIEHRGPEFAQLRREVQTEVRLLGDKSGHSIRWSRLPFLTPKRKLSGNACTDATRLNFTGSKRLSDLCLSSQDGFDDSRDDDHGAC